MAESITEGTLKSWSKKVGDSVEADEEVATIETDKIDVSVNAPKSGRCGNYKIARLDLFRIEPGQVDASPSPPPKEEKKTESKPAVSQADTRKPQDVEKAAAREEIEEERVKTLLPACRGWCLNGNEGEDERDRHILAYFHAEKCKDAVLKEHDVKLGFMSAFVKASRLALKEIPVAIASIDGGEIVYHDYVDTTVSVATTKGLVTPVIRNSRSSIASPFLQNNAVQICIPCSRLVLRVCGIRCARC